MSYSSFTRGEPTKAQTFAPQAVVAYAVGFVFFAVVPYFLIIIRTPAGTAWLDAGLLVARLLFAVALLVPSWLGVTAAGACVVAFARAGSGGGTRWIAAGAAATRGLAIPGGRSGNRLDDLAAIARRRSAYPSCRHDIARSSD